ncbi:hypothetical protein [Streptomyces iconiensis]|uniref:DNA-directed RNA polymerase specialized sigma subunit, sigma24 family n=1 Tax=Streptomyces iconiensis TaxID=1384038 RepID=A0ABT7A7Z1_9ACTN|nr:hypothetical protein [Streptomyces iconiensis]MDJ1137421.1 hypothetical protein [Streptomyces iconiensis]
MTSAAYGSGGHPWAPSGSIDVEQAEAALVEHYPRLVRIAYLLLPSSLGRHRRVLAAHGVAQRALPRGRVSTASVPLPGPRSGVPAWARPDPVYACLRLRVLRGALAAERPRRFGPPLPVLPGLLPWLVGLRLFPRAGGADELALDHALSRVSATARAVHVLRELEGLADRDIRRLLRELRLPDAEAAFRAADGVEAPPGSRDGSLLESQEFDACTLQARPTDLLRRGQHRRAAAAAAVAVVMCGGLLGLPGDSWSPGPDSAKPPYALPAGAQRAQDPGSLTRVSASAWRTAARTDFSAWPTRGQLTRNEPLLSRALAAWARPDSDVRVSAARGTATGPPPGPPQLLYAGRVDGAAVVLLYDGLRVARYTEPLDRDEVEERGVALDLARTDRAGAAASGALVIARGEGNARYLTAPWVARTSVVDLLAPSDTDGRRLRRDQDGVTEPVASPDTNPRACDRWPGLSLEGSEDIEGSADASQLYTDLGELTPVRLTDGEGDDRGAATGEAARVRLARTACHFPALIGIGVKSVNSWEFARQKLPEGDGEAAWVCTRAETWRGGGARVMAQFQPPTRSPGRPGAAVSRANGSPACGGRERAVLTGVLWKSRAGDWYVLAAADDSVVRMRAQGKGVEGSPATSDSHTLAVPARPGVRAALSGEREDGSRVLPLR